MEGSGWTKTAWWFGLWTAGSVWAAITTPHHIGCSIGAVVLAAITVRCWVLGR